MAKRRPEKIRQFDIPDDADLEPEVVLTEGETNDGVTNDVAHETVAAVDKAFVEDGDLEPLEGDGEPPTPKDIGIDK